MFQIGTSEIWLANTMQVTWDVVQDKCKLSKNYVNEFG